MLKRSQMKGGFSLVGVMVASVIGIIAAMGLTQLSITVQRSLAKSQREFNLIGLKKAISSDFSKKQPGNPQQHSCSNSLRDYPLSQENDFFIVKMGSKHNESSGLHKKTDVLYAAFGTIKSNLVPNPTTPTDGMYNKVRIDRITYKPHPFPFPSPPPSPPYEGTVTIHFSTTEDKKERLSASIPLQLRIRILNTSVSHGATKIDTCEVKGELSPIINPLIGEKCPNPGETVYGFDGDGKIECGPLPLDTGNPSFKKKCDPNEILVGFDTDGKIECRPLVKRGTITDGSFKKECDPGEVLYGFDATTGEFLCRSLPSLPSITQQLQQLTVKECPPGKALRGFKANGEIKCDP